MPGLMPGMPGFPAMPGAFLPGSVPGAVPGLPTGSPKDGSKTGSRTQSKTSGSRKQSTASVVSAGMLQPQPLQGTTPNVANM